ncbi:MAG: hypothetical protein EP330_01665 [Deltaproteobacteria bacterium]|nr:MAG: hypothetical protein EP330_01665 [Deltaproteobacteria bacterium]
MARNLDRLASRLESALASRATEPLVDHAARNALLDEWRALGEALELQVGKIRGGGLAIARGGRYLALLPDAGGSLRVVYPGAGDEKLTRDPTGRWLWRSAAGSAVLDDAGIEGLMMAAFDLPDVDAAHTAAAAERAVPKGPRDGEIGHMGRSGTRGFKRARDLPPGSVVKDLKGPLD